MSVTPTSRAVRELIRWASDDWGGTLPIAVGMRSNASDMRGVSKPLTDKGLAVLDGPEELFRALSLYAAYTDRRDAASGRMSKRVLAKGGTMTVTAGTPRESTYWGARRALSGLRLPFNPAVLVASADEATEAARRIGFPVTMKISKLDVPHKAMAGAVVDLVTTSDEVQNTARRFLASWGGGLPDGDTEGLVIERYAASRLAVFVGAQRDLEFGPMALFGLGGSYAERYADIRFIPLPTTHAEIEEAIAATNMGALICGIGAAALKDCVEVVSTIGEWFCNTPSARSVDLNPLLVGGAGEISIVDARISWQEQGR
jgi:acyl-CoA synthetase (NDP forming)